MPKSKKLNVGIGAECSVLIQQLHPRKEIHKVFLNPRHKERLEGLIAIRCDFRKVNNKMRSVILFRHDRFPNIELYCCKKFCIVKKEGHETQFFFPSARSTTANGANDTTSNNLNSQNQNPNMLDVDSERSEEIEIPTTIVVGNEDDIALMRASGITVEDDNDPLPENIPNEANPIPQGNELYNDQSWGWEGFDERKINGFKKCKPKLVGINDLVLQQGMTVLAMFLFFFPKLLVDIILEATNIKIGNTCRTLSYGEFLRWLGIHLLMSTCKGYSRKDYWSLKPISPFEGAPYRMNEYMSHKRFEEILSHFSFTSKDPPSYRDKFWEIREMIKIWNTHMDEIFIPSWVSCLDESMSSWHNKYTCPGFVYCPRKPHPFGNEFHDICCSECNIVYQIELVEGKDHPKEIPIDANETEFGKTTALLLRLCRPIFHTGKVVILDSGFSVLKALINLKKHGVFASAVIKKRRYWPAYVKGDVIDEKMKDKDLGECDAIKGKMDGVTYHLFCMKDVNYVSKMMTTYGSLLPNHDSVQTSRVIPTVGGETRRKSFHYTEVFDNHFKYRHSVDDNNNLRHQEPSIESTWRTQRWSVHIFGFILAICEVNAFLAFRFFVWPFNKSTTQVMTLLQFRTKLAQQLIFNEYLMKEEQEANGEKNNGCKKSKRNREENHDHVLKTAPKHARNFSFAQDDWICTAKTMYPQYTCKHPGCKKNVRTYCSCNIGYWMCKEHHHSHLQSCFIAC